MLQEATCLLSEELQLSADAPGGMPEYRVSLVTSFFFKFYLTVSRLLSADSLPEHLYSATHTYHRSVAGWQSWGNTYPQLFHFGGVEGAVRIFGICVGSPCEGSVATWAMNIVVWWCSVQIHEGSKLRFQM